MSDDPLDDLLDEAIGALRAEEADADDGEATLARLLTSAEEANGDAQLDEAVAALRAATAPVSPSLEARTLARVQSSLAPAPARRWGATRNALAVAAVLGIVWVAPSAWAFTRGAVTHWMAEVGLLAVEPAPPVPVAEPSVPPPSVPEPPASPTAPPTPAPSVTTPSEPAAPVAPRLPAPPPAPRRVRAPAPTLVPTPEPVSEPVSAAQAEPATNAETVAFTEAHRRHFAGARPAATLAAWDVFLAAHPSGRYELEARYNRATTLVRLGRLAAARAALAPFANGEHGGYRQSEASRLVEALDARLTNTAETP
ncbi:MAG: hypothetical protein AB8I08_40980 [Sandaracinaceae bacterium]